MRREKIVEVMAKHTHDATPFFNKRPWDELEPVERAVYIHAETRKINALEAAGYVLCRRGDPNDPRRRVMLGEDDDAASQEDQP